MTPLVSVLPLLLLTEISKMTKSSKRNYVVALWDLIGTMYSNSLVQY